MTLSTTHNTKSHQRNKSKQGVRNMRSEYTFEVHCSVEKRRQRYWSRIKSSNGKIVWTSEMYTTKQNALIPVNKLIEKIGKKNCSLKFFEGSE